MQKLYRLIALLMLVSFPIIGATQVSAAGTETKPTTEAKPSGKATKDGKDPGAGKGTACTDGKTGKGYSAGGKVKDPDGRTFTCQQDGWWRPSK
jgi:hypothetical protein